MVFNAPPNPGLLSRLSTFMSRKLKGVPVISGLIGLNIVLAAGKVWLYDRSMAHEGFHGAERKLLTTQEAVSRTLSTGMWLASICVINGLVEKIFHKKAGLASLLGAELISAIPDTIIRGPATAKITRWLIGPGATHPPKALPLGEKASLKSAKPVAQTAASGYVQPPFNQRVYPIAYASITPLRPF